MNHFTKMITANVRIDEILNGVLTICGVRLAALNIIHHSERHLICFVRH